MVILSLESGLTKLSLFLYFSCLLTLFLSLVLDVRNDQILLLSTCCLLAGPNRCCSTTPRYVFWSYMYPVYGGSLPTACCTLVSRGHTPFRKRGKGFGNFRYSSLLPRTVECRTNHGHMEKQETEMKQKLEIETGTKDTLITGAISFLSSCA